MQVEELFDLTLWIALQVSDLGIIQKYRDLHNILIHNSQNPNQQPLEAQKTALIEALGNVQVELLSNGQLELLEKIEVAPYLGERGISYIEDTLYRNAVDTATATSQIDVAATKIENGSEWADDLGKRLSKIIDTSSVQPLDDQAIMRIHFTAGAHLSNVTEFKDWGKTWYEIGRGISHAHGQAPEAIVIIGASQGSIILTLAAIYPIAKTTSLIVMDILKLIEKVHKIRKTAEEVRALQIANDQAEVLLSKAEEEKSAGVERITQNCVEHLGLGGARQGDKVTELTKSIRLLAAFLDQGGEIDFVVPDESSEADADDPSVQSRAELRTLFADVRRLELEVKKLEHSKTENDAAAAQ